MTVQQAIDLAIQHHRAGQLQRAESIYRQILTAFPEQADALHLLGVLSYQANQPQPAMELIQRAIAIAPDMADYHYNLGQILASCGRLDESVASYRRATELKADYADAFNNMGVSLLESKRTVEAIEAYRKAIALRPEAADFRSNISNALRDNEQIDEAIAEAQRATELDPSYAQGHNNLGASLMKLRRLDEAEQCYRQAIKLMPDYPLAHHNLAMVLLLTGRLEEGLPGMELRWRAKELGLISQAFRQPMWDGSDLNGRKILLWTEQGFGDAIQFVRYLPMIQSRGGEVVLGCPPELVRLFRTVPGVGEIVTTGDREPTFDVHCPLVSLPLAFKTTLQTVPANIPYLTADKDLVEQFRSQMGPHQGKRKIGLVWAGSRHHSNDRNRSVSLEMLAPLAKASNAVFFSLQMDQAAQQAQNPPAGMELIDWTSQIKDFADSAALIANLDLLITVDTAPAHLAGALGKPVWMLVPFLPDWRWMVDRMDSPWYPTMKLFRQPARGDWKEPIEQIARELP